MRLLLIILGIIVLAGAVSILAIGILFKIMHWPFGNEMALFGGLSLLLGGISLGVGLAIKKNTDQ